MIINDTIINADLSDILIELKKQLDLNGINLISRQRDCGDNIMISCPYHNNGQERRPSSGVRKSDGVFHCFACNETHSLQELISHCFGYTNDLIGVKGWNWLLKNFNTVSVENRKDIKLDFERITEVPNSVNYVSDDILESYRYYHPYMYKRGMTDEVIDIFDIGYDCNTNCITFPVRDISGGTLFVARRSVKSKYFNYPAGAYKPIYGIYELSRLSEYPKEIYVCESMIDCITLWKFKKYSVALNGLGSYSQLVELNKLPCRKLILATDMDIRGQQARLNIKKHISNKIVTELILPEGRKDINECTDDEIRYQLKEVF